MDPDGRELVRRCLQGDQDACASLVQDYAQMVGTVIWRATGDHNVVEDLAQETFLRVFRGLRYFDARSKLSTWIYTIAHRVAIDYLRQVRLKEDTTYADSTHTESGYAETTASATTSARRVVSGVNRASHVVSGFSRTSASAASDPESTAARREIDRIVRAQLDALPEKYRLPLLYATIEELDYQTIAAMLKVNPGTVKTLVFRARQLLRARVESVLALQGKGTNAP